MATRFSDVEITQMLAEKKQLSADFSGGSDLRQKRGHLEKEFDAVGADGRRYKLILRQSSVNHLDFSVILAFCPLDSNLLFRLRRHNGKSHEHTNRIEQETFYGFHIHCATERYQELGMREDSFAIPTDTYADLHGAISCLLSDCNIESNGNSQLTLA